MLVEAAIVVGTDHGGQPAMWAVDRLAEFGLSAHATIPALDEIFHGPD